VSDQERLEDLLDRWEELSEAGSPMTARDLCRDCPELLGEVERRVRALEGMAWLSEPDGEQPPTAVRPAVADGPVRTPGDAGQLSAGDEPVPGYRLVRPLGRGGFGEVWRAAGPGGVEVALKFVALEGRAGESELRALDAVKGLRHPNLLALSGVWQRGGFLVLALELADRTLLDRHREAAAAGLPGIPAPELLEYLGDAARGLDFLNGTGRGPGEAGASGVQHRDVKPQNLFLVGGRVKVGDLGLARAVGPDGTGHSGGLTVAYAAPEFLAGQTSGRSDQYSLAATYCQLRGGRLPFAGSPAQVVAGHLHQAPELSMLPEPERAAVARALAKRPQDRWPSCGAFVEALRQALAAVPPQVSAAAAPRATGTGRRRGLVIAAAVGLSLAALALLALWGLLHGPGGGSPGGERTGSAKAEGPAFTNSVGMLLVRIPPGKFLMGSPAGVPNRQADEEVHAVEISRPFYLGAHEVTVGQFRRFAEDTGYRTEAEEDGKGWGFDAAAGQLRADPTYSWKDPGWDQTERHPVTNVTLRDAHAFCTWLGRQEGLAYRLPTEAEWEYACRAGTKGPWYSGDDETSLQGSANTADASLRKRLPTVSRADPWDDGQPFTAPVGQFRANGFGLYDMLGNVWEWCEDRYGRYDPLVLKDPRGPAEGDRWVRRGGSWSDPAVTCRAAFRAQGAAGDRFCNLGFRVACDPSGEGPR
jgi:formylglycine-generating enzyme required for sulfatase activity